MSRSYKKTPRCGDKKDKYLKRYANRKLRRKKLFVDLQNKSYKKDFCSYDICDYQTIGLSWIEFSTSWLKHFPDESIKDLRKKYYRWYLMK